MPEAALFLGNGSTNAIGAFIIGTPSGAMARGQAAVTQKGHEHLAEAAHEAVSIDIQPVELGQDAADVGRFIPVEVATTRRVRRVNTPAAAGGERGKKGVLGGAKWLEGMVQGPRIEVAGRRLRHGGEMVNLNEVCSCRSRLLKWREDGLGRLLVVDGSDGQW